MLLFGCSDNTEKIDNSKITKMLNTSNLEKISSHTEKAIPIDYIAPTTKDAINALPYEVTLPSEFPISYNSFEVTLLQDVKHDKKRVRAEFQATSSDSLETTTVFTSNQESTYMGTRFKEININDDIKGNFNGQSLNFKFNDVYYNLTVEKSDSLPTEKEVIALAKQMID